MDQQNLSIPVVAPAAPALPRDAFKAGQAVGGRWWPYQGAHPGCWLPPWRGRVLALDDPRAWVKSMVEMKTPGKPTRREIRAHIAHMEKLWAECPAAAGRPPIFGSTVSVMWDYGASGMVIQREDATMLHPYAVARAFYEKARAEGLAFEERRHAAWLAAQASRAA